MTVTFGDLADQVGEHLTAAITSWDPAISNLAETAAQLHRLLAVMARFMDDAAPCGPAEALRRPDLAPWQRGAVDVAAALHLATDALQRNIPSPGDRAFLPVSPSGQHLAAACTALQAGRDLLCTHQIIRTDGQVSNRSEWAPVVFSAPARKAILKQVAVWAADLAPWAAELAFPRPGSPQPAQAGQSALTAVSRWMRAAAAAQQQAAAGEAPSADDDLLLRSIPPVVPPPRQPPHADEAAGDLCHAIPVTAQRLAAAVRDEEARMVWSPAATADRWRWMAAEAAVASDLSEKLLRHVAARARQLGMPARQSLLTAAVATADSRAAWHQIAAWWGRFTTETRVPMFRAARNTGGRPVMVPGGPAVAEAHDLVLRLGRLVWDDPAWTPATGSQARPRTRDALAPDEILLAAVAAAVHHSAAAFARVAGEDFAAVAIVARAQRLYVPTRLAPQRRRDFPYPYCPAPRTMVAELQQTYRETVAATGRAARALDRVAVALNGPSKALALARTAAAQRRSQSRSSDWPSLPRRPRTDSGADPGPVTAELRHIGVTDPLILLSAAAIDSAGEDLLHDDRRGPEPEPQMGRVEAELWRQNVTDPLTLLRAAALDRAGKDLIEQARRGTTGHDVSAGHASRAVSLTAASFPHGPAVAPGARPAPRRRPGASSAQLPRPGRAPRT